MSYLYVEDIGILTILVTSVDINVTIVAICHVASQYFLDLLLRSRGDPLCGYVVIVCR